MFWALNGATRSPRRANRRHSPATSVLLPADDAVPWTMSTGAGPLASVTGYSVDGIYQPLTLLGQPASNAHELRPSKRGTVAYHEAVRQERLPEAGTVAHADQNEVGLGWRNLEPEVSESVGQQPTRPGDNRAGAVDVRHCLGPQCRESRAQRTGVDAPWRPHALDRTGDFGCGEQEPEPQAWNGVVLGH